MWGCSGTTFDERADKGGPHHTRPGSTLVTIKRTNATGDDAEASASKRSRTEDPVQFSSLPVELIQLILRHLVSSISPDESIHFHRNHQGYNRYLAELWRLVLVNKLFHQLLTPYLYREIRLPRHSGYASSAQTPEEARRDGIDRDDPHNNVDISALFLAKQLQLHPEKASLVKRIHLDPVVRLKGKAAMDCDAYTTILKQCKDTVEELAIAVNNCDGKVRKGRNWLGSSTTYVDTLGTHLALKQFANARMPKLKHLILEFMEIRQLDLILWDQLHSLEQVTLLVDNLFDLECHDEEFTGVNMKQNALFQGLARIPRTVKRLTLGFVYDCELSSFEEHTRGDTPDHAFQRERGIGTLAATLSRAQKEGYLEHLQELRLVWTYTSDHRHRCIQCESRDRQSTYTLPKLRIASEFEALCKDSLAHLVEFRTHADDPTNSTKPRIRMSEVMVPMAYRPTEWEQEAMCGLEVLWKSLVYGGDKELDAADIHDEISEMEDCPNEVPLEDLLADFNEHSNAAPSQP